MRIIYGWILCVSVSFACENRVFDLTLQDFEVKIYEVLSEFANTCSFSVVYGDDAADYAQSIYGIIIN